MLCFPTKTTFHFIVSKRLTTFSLAFTTEMQNPMVSLRRRAQILRILALWKLLFYYYYTYLPPLTHPFLPLSLATFLPSLPSSSPCSIPYSLTISLSFAPKFPCLPSFFPLFRVLPSQPFIFIDFYFSYFHLYFHPGVHRCSPSPVYFLSYLSLSIL